MKGFEQRRKASEAKGLKRGMGYSSYIEACGIAPSNIAVRSVRARACSSAARSACTTGSVTVFTGSHSHGQGHETTFAQVVAARLGIPVENVDVVHGDTGRVPFGMGTYGSRSISVGGAAIMRALDKIETKAKKIAAHLMEAGDGDVEFSNGEFRVKGTDKKVTFGQVALTAYVPHNYPLDKLEPGLNETAFYDPTNFTFPGRHLHLRGGGRSRHRRGARRPLHRGGRLRHHHQPDDRRGPGARRRGAGHRPGAAGALRVRQGSGQLLTGSFMDYAMPRADDFPTFKLDTVCTPCTQPAGHQGLRRSRRDRLAAGGDQRVLDA